MSKTGTNSEEVLRPPIVTILGHVDHGKTTLLDAIRKTNVAVREIGGITQGIGASQVTTPSGQKITFIDTPGHAAFSQMRERGAKVADIAVLVVAADDGVKPQTKEALSYIKSVKIPFIVALTKIDLPQASVEKTKGQIEKEGVTFEGKGGDTPVVVLSAKSGKGVNELVEMVLLVSEVNAIKGNANGELEGFIIETSKDKRGPVVSAVITNGIMKVGMEIYAEEVSAKVRGLFDYLGKAVREVYPGDPTQILGFSELPPIGAKITTNVHSTATTTTSENRNFPKIEEGKIPVVIKTNNAGALKDLIANLPKEIIVINSSLGDVSDGDIFTAKSASLVGGDSPPRIFAFESKVPAAVSKFAEEEGVAIERFELIYKLFERLDQLISEGKQEILGEAQIQATFPFNNKQVAGTKVIKGRILKSDKLVLTRNKEIIGNFKILSMRKDKENIDKAESGEEFGIIMAPQLDFRVGDVILSVTK